jgi:translation initiation factor eIF-2B subunit epsilon
VGSGVEIKDSSVVERGSLIGDKVVIGPGAKLKPFDRLSVPWAAGASGNDDDEDEDSDIEDAEKGQCSLDWL